MLTAVFDNVLVGDRASSATTRRCISGVLVGVAPIEDFAYAIAAVVLLPSLWHCSLRTSTGSITEAAP